MMMHLLKYDWKRNATTLLASFLVFAVVELAGEFIVTNADLALVMLIVGYVGLFILIFIVTIKTYSQNIMSYSRRLLPVGPLSYIFSPMVLGLACEFVLGLVFLLHNWLRQQATAISMIDLVQATSSENASIHWASVASAAVAALWAMFVMTLVFFTAITIGRSVQVRAQAWVIVISYLILENGFGMIESALNLPQFPWLVNSVNRVAYSDQIRSGLHVYAGSEVWGSFAIEAVFSLAMVIVIAVLLNRRVEVK